MAYSDIENRYLNALASLQFPDVPEGTVEVGPLTPDPERYSGNVTTDATLATSPNGVMLADAGTKVGRAGVPFKGPTMSDVTTPLTALADTGAGIARGAVAQTLGIGGDLESLFNGLRAVFNRPEDQSRLDAFISGMEANTVLPTTEDISKKLPPVVPAGAPDAQARQHNAEVGQAFGQVAPLPTAVDAGVAGLKAGAKALGPTASQMVENYLTKTGAILKMTPDSPGIEVPAAPKLNTPAFKKWFGDSKAVDDKGQPLVVYHGTDQSFDEFRGNAYFTPMPEDASKYSYVNTPGKEHSPNVIPVYLSLQKPKTIKTYATRADIDDAKAAGFDGVIVQGVGGSKINHYIVFESTQIKSLFNKGTFDPKDPRILHGGGAAAVGAATQGEEKK